MNFDNSSDYELYYNNETISNEDYGAESGPGQQFVWPGRSSPTWAKVHSQLKWALMLHSYGFACTFLVLAFYAFFSILNIRSLLTSRPYMSTINVFLCILGSSRAICLFIDAYALRDVMPSLMGGVLWDVAVPSLLSVLALLQLAVLRVSQLSGRPRFLLTSSAISIAITIHFTSVLAVDLSLALHSNMLTVKYIIETVFHVWGLFLCITFLYTAHRAREVLRNMPSAVLERDIDVQYKGIMQLTMLAPYNNLATSVAAALVPTLLAPKLMHKKPLQAESSSSKTEPVKTSIMKPTPKQSPTSSDNDEPKNLVDSRERRGNKKLSWGPEKRISGQTQRKIQQTTSARRRAEEETEDANTSLLPPHNKLQTDLTLDTILNHIAYMNRGGVSQTSQTRKKSLQQVLTLATMAPLLSMGLLLVGLFRLYTPPEWYTQCCGWWLWFETACRALELVVAWCAANLTKQPLSNSGLYHRTGGAGGGEAKTRQSMFM
ncbi:uncharacterized protein isoform X2 [Rhodnius prolixus]|uniref:uncharacterized protein isoform X2 n=1 Tax=Rhodnius prolixus TaxID=13249 RepID=UPI003D18C8DE